VRHESQGYRVAAISTGKQSRPLPEEESHGLRGGLKFKSKGTKVTVNEFHAKLLKEQKTVDLSLALYTACIWIRIQKNRILDGFKDIAYLHQRESA
jgi:hypothetical protein